MVRATRLLFVLLLPLMWPLNSWALPADIQAAKDEGMRLWGISGWIEMQPYLEQSAEAGDVESMYYLGEATRLLGRGLTTEAMEWYLKAAEQGDPYAMLRLFQGGACIGGECPEGSDDWREAALDITLPKAEAGDPEAMLAMYYIYANLDASWVTSVYNLLGIPTRAVKWLKRAAEAGLPEAQTTWGRRIMGGGGWYFTKNRRLEAAESWFSRAAEQGYVPAMEQMERVNREQQDFETSWRWMVQASNNGSYEGRLGVGWCYLDTDFAPDQNCTNEEDRIKGWAILYAMSQELGGNSTPSSIMNRNQDKLDESERQEAEALAESEWIGRQPPISKFPRRFGF
ncbi:sel1 repeat family protein [Halomonas sp. SH5A2]|uniref:tetratricopeptide repeat protein n=1 Tax=Halomonas sp. SH5A2 TaxID=2749040 RepID=UPI00163F1E30|nr:tetratricopeptide repeat protein [Halomonas sp. SH5A2]QNI02359.1 sel1 repeat family protein [Halomonas sp. SH5A2]